MEVQLQHFLVDRLIDMSDLRDPERAQIELETAWAY
jgi:hypothetical protein